jgi:hypothetical protein
MQDLQSDLGFFWCDPELLACLILGMNEIPILTNRMRQLFHSGTYYFELKPNLDQVGLFQDS